MTTIRFSMIAAAALSVLTACSPAKNPEPSDPIESWNRGVFAFNQVADDFVLEPVARGYRYITPQVARTSVSNFFSNVREPITFANSLLQGNVTGALTSFWRFAINSTVGLGGLLDVADSSTDLKKNKEDLGQTFGTWGWTNSTYLVLPIMGPTTTRDALGMVGDYWGHPTTYYLETDDQIYYRVAEGISTREGLLDLTDDIKETSLDPYATYRSLYLQRRDALITNRAATDADVKKAAE
jgi:phospholipid-binding lipoprotein MlaA